MMSLKQSYVLSLLSFFGLILLVIFWNGFVATDEGMPRSAEVALYCVPVLCFLRGILNGKRSTYVASMVLAFMYFMVGIWYAVTPDERLYGVLIIVLSFGMYLGGYFYAKAHDRMMEAKLAEHSSE